ncbi:3-oxoacyl-[acyl-carrier-protein] reductase [Niallia oryzisoli]|uniref:3-oxoacyl-[acyl-carrier-protein] reductase n=1 Tax=Niallia oryzisoli TaxID=1737571 RepID=A0ABZ2CAX2_9BACI
MLENQVAIITGSSQGIGAEMAKYFARLGASVVINYPFESEKERAREIVQGIASEGGKVIALKANVTNEDEVSKLVENTVKEFGRIDILVNNAGITRDSTMKKMTVEDFKFVLDTNLVGSFITSKAVLQVMADQGYGRIVNISSISGLQGNFGQANYASSKAGIVGLTKTMAIEYAKKGITVNAVAPGFVRTPMTDKIPEEIKSSMIAQIPVNRIGEPEDIAAATAFLASTQAGYITGQILSVNGGVLM